MLSFNKHTKKIKCMAELNSAMNIKWIYKVYPNKLLELGRIYSPKTIKTMVLFSDFYQREKKW